MLVDEKGRGLNGIIACLKAHQRIFKKGHGIFELLIVLMGHLSKGSGTAGWL